LFSSKNQAKDRMILLILPNMIAEMVGFISAARRHLSTKKPVPTNRQHRLFQYG
jgi:hypothetical protein